MKLKNLDLNQLSIVATNLAQALAGSPVTIGFIGPLGVGKTTFIKQFVKALGVKKSKSPSFIITHQYESKHGSIYHIDFYRLENSSQLEPLGLEEIINGGYTVLIEWVDKFPRIKKSCDILIKINLNSQKGRDVEIISN